jgi:hypothetical protein
MIRFLLFVLVVLFASPAPEVRAGEGANKIIGRYKKAVGGSAVKRVKSRLVTGTVQGTDGWTGRFLLQTASPDRMRVDIEGGQIKISECYNGKSAWRMDSRGLRTLLGAEAKRLRLEALLANNYLHDLSRDRIIAQPPVRSNVDGHQANTIEFAKEDVRVKLSFDVTTNLPIKLERERADGVEEILYSDYRTVDRVAVPFSMRLKTAAGEFLVTVDRVEHNHAVDAAAFRYPAPDSSRPLPDLETLFKSLISNQEKIEELQERYTYRLTETTRKLDGSGRAKETETKVYEVTPVAGGAVERLVSINGKELSASDQEKEDRRVQKEVTELIKEKEKKLKKQQKAQQQGKPREYEDDEVAILDFLRISEVTSVRREMFRGQEVIAFDFEPRKGFKPRNRTENIVSKLAGTIWVDEKAQQVARLEARLTSSFKIGGGLFASVAPSTAFVFEQEKVGDEVWLPSYGEANISARVLLFAKFNRSLERRYSDYKKYHIDSEYQLTKPKEPAKPAGAP